MRHVGKKLRAAHRPTNALVKKEPCGNDGNRAMRESLAERRLVGHRKRDDSAVLQRMRRVLAHGHHNAARNALAQASRNRRQDVLVAKVSHAEVSQNAHHTARRGNARHQASGDIQAAKVGKGTAEPVLKNRPLICNREFARTQGRCVETALACQAGKLLKPARPIEDGLLSREGLSGGRSAANTHRRGPIRSNQRHTHVVLESVERAGGAIRDTEHVLIFKDDARQA